MAGKHEASKELRANAPGEPEKAPWIDGVYSTTGAGSHTDMQRIMSSGSENQEVAGRDPAGRKGGGTMGCSWTT